MKKKILFVSLILSLLIFVGFVDPYSRRIRPFTSVPVSCAENEIGYSMTLHTLHICTNTGYKSVDFSGITTYAPIGAKYIVQIADANLTNEQALSALATGIVKNTTTTGVLSIAASGTDYELPLTFSSPLVRTTNNIACATCGVTGTGLGQFAATTSSTLAGVISDELGSGSLIFSAGTLNITSAKTFNVSNNLTLTATDGSTLAIGGGGTLGTAAYTATSAYEVPLTFSTGLTRSTNTITINTSQNISTLSNLTSNGFVKTSGGTGALSIDTVSYLPLTGGTLSGILHISTTGNTLFDLTTTTASNAAYLSFINGTSTNFIGQESNSGGSIATGSSAFATVIRPATGKVIQFSKADGSAITATFNDSGATIVGATNSATFGTATNCSDSAGAAACGSAAAGSFVVDASSTSTVVSTTAVTANSQIFVEEDSSLGTRLGVTCNTQSSLILGTGRVTARTAATSFTLTLEVGPTSNPACFNYWIVN